MKMEKQMSYEARSQASFFYIYQEKGRGGICSVLWIWNIILQSGSQKQNCLQEGMLFNKQKKAQKDNTVTKTAGEVRGEPRMKKSLEDWKVAFFF